MSTTQGLSLRYWELSGIVREETFRGNVSWATDRWLEEHPRTTATREEVHRELHKIWAQAEDTYLERDDV